MNSLLSQSSVHISPVPIPADPSAILNVQSASQGVLLPRTTTNSVITPSDGLIIYDTILNSYMMYDGIEWTRLLKANEFNLYYADRDGDGYGDLYAAIYATSMPAGYVASGTDCDDANPASSPGNAELCDGIDNDCNPITLDGSAEPSIGMPCDGPDTDLCAEGVFICQNGILVCSDNTENNVEVCDGIDNDCNPATPDGFMDPMVGTICDGPDTDFCQEGTYICFEGTLVCSDDTGNTLEICADNFDNDCDDLIDENCVIDYGVLQFPPSITMGPGNTPLIYGQVYAAGVTDSPGQGPGIMAQVGYGPDGSDPSQGGWTWVTATYNVDDGNNDEYQGMLTVNTTGTYDYAYRFSSDGGNDWVYCDLDSTLNGYSADQAGSLLVE